MFTGIIEDKGKVLRIEYRGQEKKLTIELPFYLTEVQLGDSINLNGVCLTVVKKKEQTIELDLSQETLQKTVLGELKEGDQVNLERALKLTDRFGGHIVTGHVDGIGVIVEKRKERDFLQLRIRIPESASRYAVQKGSIAIDGISLTVNEYQGGEIEITLIPYTIEKTTLMDKEVGDRVNVEADILGKYVEKLLDRGNKKSGQVDLSFLKEHGFIKED
ncbi:MAG: riboflavin synthase [Deltaproteobacteria bacterium CG_4_8_14_3_um_filter_45_9]|nr:MAG: riboflavin synthase [Deltaproteobacteria bacterium CG03_land_8_20_14_0_80_45_14]PIX21963.1 MAG: riboflavin synthase [Deltaproteobacteria bacterium CG_4_8_14_3_um_filter_45_9]